MSTTPEGRAHPNDVPAARTRSGLRRGPLAALRVPSRDVGRDPDHRFTLANERTFLSWLRTALALDAAGLGVLQLLPELVVPYAREAIAIVLVVLGTVVASVSFRRWATVEVAMRTGEPLPPSRLPVLLATTIGALSLVLVVLLVLVRV